MSKRESGAGGGKAAKIESLSLQIKELEKTVSWSTAIGFALAAATAVMATVYSRMATARPPASRREYPLRQRPVAPTCSPAEEPEKEFATETAAIAPIRLVTQPPHPVHAMHQQPVPPVEHFTPEPAIEPPAVDQAGFENAATIAIEDPPTQEVAPEHEFSETLIQAHSLDNQDTQQLLLRVEELRQKNLALEVQLEKERGIRLAFEKSLAPRILPRTSNGNGAWNFAPLTRFRGTSVIVRYLPDAEATRAASEVVDTLKASGWEIVRAAPDPQLWSEFLDGVIVESSNSRMSMHTENGIAHGPSETLIGFLHENGWAARTYENVSDIPPGVVQISIGFKPSPYRPTIGSDFTADESTLRSFIREDHW